MTGIVCAMVGASYGPPAPPTVEYLVVAGGGGSGAQIGTPGSEYGVGGNGGGGGYRTGTGFAVSKGTAYTVTVGGGGAFPGPPSAGNSAYNGGSSVFSTITSAGGGGGGGPLNPSSVMTGGSGAGGWVYIYTAGEIAAPGSAGNTPATVPSQGNNGGSAVTSVWPDISGTAGGGGGAGGVGGAGVGGAGSASSITGSPVTYSAGGSSTPSAASAAANTGNGAPASDTKSLSFVPGFNGGSGIVVIRYSDAFAEAKSTTGSPTYTVSGGYKIYKFTGSGSITW